MSKTARVAGFVVNRDELSGFFGVSPSVIDSYRRAGCPVVSEGAGRRGYEFNTADVLKWRDERDRATGEPGAKEAGETIKRRFTTAAAELKELQLAEKRKLMISIEDVAPIVADELANVRSRLLAMPGRLAPAITGMTDQAKVEAAIRGEVIAALTELTQG